MKQKNPFITKRLVFVAVCLLAASSALAWSPQLLSLTKSQREFNSMVREWTQNARTNMTVETTAKFRDTVLLPFMRREMPNPFVPGGTEAGKTWAKEANDVYDAGLRFICDENYYHVWIPDDRVSRRAGKLVEQGCEEPFILLLSAFDPEIDWINGSKESRKRFGKSREIVEKRGNPGFINVLLGYYSYRFGANRPGDAPSVSFRKWLAARSFTNADEIPIYTLCHAFCGTAAYEMFTTTKQFAWANSMGLAEKTMNEARSVAGGGVASKVPRRGWQMLAENADAANRLLDEAESARPGMFETFRARQWIAGESRRCTREMSDIFFRALTAERLDDPDALVTFYCWYRLYPRWGQTPNHEEMLRFAHACRDTQRHDTMLPFFGAEILCRYLRDSHADPYQYFKLRPEEAQWCIDACLRQATNENACGYARIRAPFVGSAVAFYAGRYEDVGKFDPSLAAAVAERYTDRIFSDTAEVYDNANMFSSMHSNRCIRLQRLFDDGHFDEIMAEIGEIKKRNELKSGKWPDRYWLERFIRRLELDIQMKTDFEKGRDVAALIPKYIHGWWGHWWRCNDRTIQTYRPFSWENHMTWRAKLPKAYELEFSLELKPKSSGRPVVVVSRFVHEESRHLPVNGIPFVTLISEENRIGAYISSDYYEMFNVDSDKASWREVQGKKQKIRITCDGKRIDVFVGESATPLASSKKFAYAFRRAPKYGFLRFHGDNVRISDITVRLPRNEPLP